MSLNIVRAFVRMRDQQADQRSHTLILQRRLWPALESVDSSSGQLGSVVNATVHEVIEYVIVAKVDRATRVKWLEQLWQARQDDGVDYTVEVADRWGELCACDDLRREWLERLQPTLLAAWSLGTAGGHFHGSTACLSCLLSLGGRDDTARRIAEITHPHPRIHALCRHVLPHR